MYVVRSKDDQTGYEFESMGADLLVKLVGLFHTDHDELFEEEERHNALVEWLGLFMDAGPTSTARLRLMPPTLARIEMRCILRA